MTSHSWGDEWEHWVDLGDAMHFIQTEFKERTGLDLMCKEKYGTLRYEHIMVITPEGPFPFDFADTTDNWKILLEIVQEAVQRYPQIADELLEDIASHEEVVGKELHDKYWTKL